MTETIDVSGLEAPLEGTRGELDQGLAGGEIRRTKDLIRIAAMLHDLGKIAISDLILKKHA